MELDLILQTFEQAFTQNIGAVMGLVQNTMYILLTIDFVLSVLIALLGNGNMLQILIEKILKYGFWVWFFRMSPTIINNIADSMALIGAAIGGDASIIQSPSAIMEHCYSLIQPIWAYATENSLSIMDLNIGQFLTLCFVIVFIFICHLIIMVLLSLFLLGLINTHLSYLKKQSEPFRRPASKLLRYKRFWA